MTPRRKAAIPYKEIDKNIAPLVRSLNCFPGIRTNGSCGGHSRPKHGQYPKGEWNVSFVVEPTEEGWFSLEFLAWLVNNDLRKTRREVHLYPSAMPPYMNFPGKMLVFHIDGKGWDPKDAALTINNMRKQDFVKPSQMERFIKYSWDEKTLREYRREKKRWRT